MSKRFPQTLYVKIEYSGGEGFFISDDDPDGMAKMGEETKVAVYKLEEVTTMTGVVRWDRPAMKKTKAKRIRK